MDPEEQNESVETSSVEAVETPSVVEEPKPPKAVSKKSVKKEAVKKESAKKAPVKKEAAKKEEVKAPAKKAAKSAPKAAKAEPKTRASSEAMRTAILAFMRKGKPFTSKEIVVGLGREPGAAGGGPVVRMLKKLETEKLVTYGSSEEYNGFVWIKK